MSIPKGEQVREGADLNRHCDVMLSYKCLLSRRPQFNRSVSCFAGNGSSSSPMYHPAAAAPANGLSNGDGGQQHVPFTLSFPPVSFSGPARPPPPQSGNAAAFSMSAILKNTSSVASSSSLLARQLSAPSLTTLPMTKLGQKKETALTSSSSTVRLDVEVDEDYDA